MSLTNKTTRVAIDEKKIRENLTFTQGKLRNLEKLSVDPVVASLLTKTEGDITLTLTGKTCNVGVSVLEKDGHSRTIVTIEEFLRTLAAPSRVKAIAKRQQSEHDALAARDLIANYLYAFGIDATAFQPVTTEIFGLIKQSFALVKRVNANIQIADVLVLKHPDDEFGPYLTRTLSLILQVVIGGIVSLITRTNTVSESNTRLLGALKVPHWSFNRFTKEPINKESTPYSLFFPRKKGKGMTCTTQELLDTAFVEANSTALSNSRLLIGILIDETFLNHAVSLNAHVADDDVAVEIYQKHPWPVLPPLEVSVDRFLELKGKVVAEVLPDAPKDDFKKKLAKVGNALLRTSLLENSGMKPDIVICRRLFPNSTTDFNPASGVDVYEALRDETGIETAVLGFFDPRTNAASDMWAELLCLEVKVPNGNQIRRSFRDIFEIAEADPTARQNLVVPDLTRLEFGRMDRFDSLTEAGQAREGSPHLAEVITLRDRAFSLIQRDEEVGKEAKKRPLPHTVLSKNGKSLVQAIERAVDKTAAQDIQDFLCGFTSMRLQVEAIQKVAASSNRDIRGFVTREDDPQDIEDEDEDAIDFH